MSDFTPQVETREISDSDLDNISGGVLGVDLSAVVNPVLGTVDTVAPVSPIVAQVSGMLPTPVTSALGL